MKVSKLLLVLAGIALAILAVRAFPVSAQDARAIPAPVLDPAPAQAGSAVTVLAGGCFWGVQGVFQHVKGVSNAVSGYAGGEAKTAEYEVVGSGRTGHAESVQITYDPTVVSYGQLLHVFFSVVHDPTQLNRQGPDSGPQYRSTIFPANAQQAEVAQAYIAQLGAAKTFRKPIVTTIEPGRTFYPAEAYHQNFLTLNPNYPYIVVNDLPKVADLKRFFPTAYRDAPVLVPTQTH